jgi:hypothetical protein
MVDPAFLEHIISGENELLPRDEILAARDVVLPRVVRKYTILNLLELITSRAESLPVPENLW